MSRILSVILILIFSTKALGNPSLTQTTSRLDQLQSQLLSRQQNQGEWAGLNEGDPRWDIFFLLHTYRLHQLGLPFMTDEKFQSVIDDTIFRLKTFRGFQKQGWALHRGGEISPKLTGSLLTALNHIDPELVRRHFSTQQSYFEKENWSVSDMSVLDRFILRMTGAPGHIMVPLTITPAMFGFERDSNFLSMASLGYYRWGYISVSVWAHFDHYRQLGLSIEPPSHEMKSRGGLWVSYPELAQDGGTEFWANGGLFWLLERPYADGNPSSALILQIALAGAHFAGVMDLTSVLQDGWNYMNRFRRPMRDGAKVFQPTVSPIWDTARVIIAADAIPKEQKTERLQFQSENMNKAVQFLLSQQDIDGGDYLMANPDFLPGGWGFAYNGMEYPDSDDTAMAVEALVRVYQKKPTPKVESAIKKGVQWLLQIQNPDGGFPAWDYDASSLIEFAIQNTDFLPNVSLEPQTDVTARVLRSLRHVNQSGLVPIPQQVFSQGCTFLNENFGRSSDPSLPLWAGTWAVNYLYGTSEVLTTLMELDCKLPALIENYMAFIQNQQNVDGGWGESIQSYEQETFVPGASTITQTLGALQVLLAYEKNKLEKNWLDKPSALASIEKGVSYFLSQMGATGDVHDENESEFTACYVCPELFVRYDLIPLYMGTEVIGKYVRLREKFEELK
ncbi:MAG: prenyltransferase/squalene oxidase repeat-containing protein [Pseudomonadota bacterium]